MSSKVETYVITVAVLEGRHYVWANMNSAVIVRIGKQKKSTPVKYHTDNPFYNEYFVFEFATTFEKIMEKELSFTVVWPKTLTCKRRVLGYISLDLATVWNQKDHRFYHKWAILTSPKSDATSGAKGYLKVDITLLTNGESPALPINIINDDIEGNLLVAAGLAMEREKVQYIFEIYHCGHLVHKPTNIVSWSDEVINKSVNSFPNTFIEISFAGIKARTSCRKNSNSPAFNEKITMVDLFPPLCQRIKIEICYQECSRKIVLSSHSLNLNSLSNDNVEGFLPTYGPTYIYLYTNQNLEGYAGSILIAMKTELDEIITARNKAVLNESISPLDEYKLWTIEDTFLFVMILDASGLKKKYFDKPISFRVTFGNILTQKGNTEGTLSNSTYACKPLKSGKNYCHISFGENMPCMVLQSKWPDFRQRMYNLNLLAKISDDIKDRLETIEDILLSHPYKQDTQEMENFLMETMDMIRSSCSKYVDLVVTMHKQTYGTRLDPERIKICLHEMEKIIGKTKPCCCGGSKKVILRKIQKIYSKIQMLMDSPQHCWPDVFLWLVNGNKKVAYIQIPAREICFSPIPEERGKHCAKFDTFFFRSENQKDGDIAACKVRAMFWLGLERHKRHCSENLPQGFKKSENDIENTSALVAEEQYTFTCRAHIFQGKCRPGFDKSSMLDAFVQILVRGQVQETTVIQQNLNPIWDQMLVFKNVVLFGSKQFIRKNMPSITVQVFDKDSCCRNEYVGKNEVVPLLKFSEDTYEEPRLKWYKMFKDFEMNAEILAAFEFIEVSGDDEEATKTETGMSIPACIKPNLINYKIEILFWGVRCLKKVNLIPVNRPRITFYCSDRTINSDVIDNAKRFPNFGNKIKSLEVVMPEQKEYTVPIRFKMYDSRKFGIYVYSGVHICDVNQFMYTPLTLFERQQKIFSKESDVNVSDDDLMARKWEKNKFCEGPDLNEASVESLTEETNTKKSSMGFWKSLFKKYRKNKSEYSLLTNEENDDFDESEDYDWWTKFYASAETTGSNANMDKAQTAMYKHRLKIYPKELEAQPEFENFSDMLKSFKLFKGKRTGDDELDEENVSGIFKGAIAIYSWPPEENIPYVTANGVPLADGFFRDFPDNFPTRYLVRVYCIRALRLKPKDLNNKSDPYLVVSLNNQVIVDRENRAMRQIDPVFGRCYEFYGTFPQDHILTISVWDYDLVTSDDLIGETEIDLENRFYTKHRASCGLPETYHESGYCQWRDQYKPSIILSQLCKVWRVEEPTYSEGSVKIGQEEFSPDNFSGSENKLFDKEVLALSAIRNWQQVPVVGCHLVPEHVETRSLYNSEQPGIEQGKVQLWIDIFPCGELPLPKQVVITPRKPLQYEIRVTIWNTEEVTLDEDDFFTGEKKSDIYVKGWMEDPDEAQYTDIHYRSFTGEGNFNWRFIFGFEYLPSENKQVFTKKENLFALSDTVFKIPCRLNLQVWDNDTFTRDGILGALTLELAKMPKGARSPENCSLSILEPYSKKINLFKLRRTKGWWPFKFVNPTTKEEILAGKLEAEFELLSKEDAEKDPAGLGRKSPQELPPPKRPDTSFSWFKNPYRGMKFVCCKLYKWKFIKALFCVLLVCFILAAMYAFPGYSIKRILGA